MLRNIERSIFKYANRYFMVPLLRRGFARMMCSPPVGYFLLLQTTGRKSKLPRLTPLNYAIDDGCVFCLAGFGAQADWLLNIHHHADVQLQLPDRSLRGIATEVQNPSEVRRLALKVARNSGFALIFENPRCLLMSDEQLADRLQDRPVVRIQPMDAPVIAGAYDPGGSGWILPMAIQALAILALSRLLWHRWQCKRRSDLPSHPDQHRQYQR